MARARALAAVPMTGGLDLRMACAAPLGAFLLGLQAWRAAGRYTAAALDGWYAPLASAVRRGPPGASAAEHTLRTVYRSLLADTALLALVRAHPACTGPARRLLWQECARSALRLDALVPTSVRRDDGATPNSFTLVSFSTAAEETLAWLLATHPDEAPAWLVRALRQQVAWRARLARMGRGLHGVGPTTTPWLVAARLLVAWPRATARDLLQAAATVSLDQDRRWGPTADYFARVAVHPAAGPRVWAGLLRAPLVRYRLLGRWRAAAAQVMYHLGRGPRPAPALLRLLRLLVSHTPSAGIAVLEAMPETQWARSGLVPQDLAPILATRSPGVAAAAIVALGRLPLVPPAAAPGMAGAAPSA